MHNDFENPLQQLRSTTLSSLGDLASRLKAIPGLEEHPYGLSYFCLTQPHEFTQPMQIGTHRAKHRTALPWVCILLSCLPLLLSQVKISALHPGPYVIFLLHPLMVVEFLEFESSTGFRGQKVTHSPSSATCWPCNLV